MSKDNIQRLEFRVIERLETHEPVGYLAHPPYLVMNGAYAFHYELKPGVSWLEASPFVARYLWNLGQEYAKAEIKVCESFGFYLGGSHPAYDALGNILPSVREPYAWYLRVPDLIGFLNHIKPVLEMRLSGSVACDHSGVYLINLYTKGIKLALEHGRIAIEDWKPDHPNNGDAGFPPLTFLQILFGHRSFDELEHAFPDCWCDNEDARVVINALFPRKYSNVYGIA